MVTSAVAGAQRVVAGAAAVLLVLSGIVLVARSGDDGVDTAVLGQSIERTSTTQPASTSSTPVAEVVPTTAGPVPIEGTTTTVVVGSPSPTTTAARSTTTIESRPQGRSVEKADTTSAFDYRADGGGGTMTTTDGSPPRDPFLFKTLGSDTDHDGVCELRAEMANQSSRDITFPDGLTLRFVITRDGQQWRTVELRFPDTQTLPAGGSLEVESATPLNQQYGRYQVGGEVTIQYS